MLHAHRGDAGKQAHCAHACGVDVGQWRVHVVAAGGVQVHAVELDAQPVVLQSVHAGQAGDAARWLSLPLSFLGFLPGSLLTPMIKGPGQYLPEHPRNLTKLPSFQHTWEKLHTVF